MTRASGIGSWPGSDAREAIVTVRDLLTDTDIEAIPYLPELPSRGPGSDLVGRAGALLVDLPIELQPSGWRLTDRPGRDMRRAHSWERADLDEVAEAYDGYAGPLKVQVPGPWTLAAAIELPRGQRVVSDTGARRDLVASLGEGVRRYATEVSRLVPRAEVILQIDEPGVVAVMRGDLPTASGLGRLRSVESAEVISGLREVSQAYAARTVVHSCHPEVPLEVLAAGGFDGVALDLSGASPQRWEAVAAVVESGVEVWAGVVGGVSGAGAARPSTAPNVREVVAEVRDGLLRTGLAATALNDLTITPTCGLAGLTPAESVLAQRMCVQVARELTDASQA